MNRRNFFTASAGAALLLDAAEGQDSAIPDYQKPVFNLRKFFPNPVKIASIELLQSGKHYFVRTRSTDGVEGVVQTKDMEDFIPILLRRVIPHFLGKDARDLESLVDDVYIANYKLSGQAFWCPVAYVEQSLFDLLGKTARKTRRGTDGRHAAQGNPGLSLRIGARHHRRRRGRRLRARRRGDRREGGEVQDRRPHERATATPIPDAPTRFSNSPQKKLAGKVTLMADANGCYSAAKAIEIGKRLQEMKYLWFEEPCPWEELSETKKVADALDMKVAFGEQDSSLWLFQWMIENKVIDVVQPDLNYNGGFTRAARVARMARKANMWICPHNTQTGAASVNILQFAASTPNIGPYMEYVSPRRGKEGVLVHAEFRDPEWRDSAAHRPGHGPASSIRSF